MPASTMLETRGYAAKTPKAKLAPFNFQRRAVGKNDVLVEILFCGVCHSDIHQARDEWGGGIFPMVPGHEIVGRVARVGKGVKGFKVGDIAGVGCFVDSCRKCGHCKRHLEQYCERHFALTYNGTEMDLQTPTYGGYSNQIVVDQRFVMKVPKNLDPARVAPLLCAGITTYSPLKHWKIGKGHRLGVMGLGGLGHMAVKLGKAFGAHVTVLSTSPGKKADAKKLGAKDFILTTDKEALSRHAGSLDFILSTVAAKHDLGVPLGLLKTDGTLIMVGVPENPLEFHPGGIIMQRKKIGGSLVGGTRETQEMLNFCGKHKIMADVELIKIQQVNEAYDRTVRGDVKYRFVIDMASL
jgi:uncharacterized zinc-type alcohol dehydrogenase-like protein